MLISCGDDNSGDPKSSYRLIYYPASSQDGSSGLNSGLFFVRTDDLISSQLVPNPVVYTTGLGNNGVIVFEYEEADNKLWGKCESGDLMPVPIPDVKEDYISRELIYPPRIRLSADEHNVAFFIKHIPQISAGLMDHYVELVIFNCQNGNTIRVPINEFARQNFDSINANGGRPYGSYVTIDKDGKTVWFVLKGIQYSGNDELNKMYSVAEWNENTGLRLISEPTRRAFEIMGMDYISKDLVIKFQNELKTIKTLEQDGEEAFNNLTSEMLSNPNQMAVSKDETVCLTNYGIEIFRTDNGNLIRKVISWEEIDPSDKYDHQYTEKITFSKDAQVIVFALQYKDIQDEYTLFMVDRDGEKLVKLADKLPVGTPVISAKMSD